MGAQSQQHSQAQTEFQTQDQIAIQILLSTQEDFINILNSVKENNPEALQSNIFIGLLSVRANYQKAGHNLQPAQREEFVKQLNMRSNKKGCGQAVNDALAIYGSLPGAAAHMDQNKYLDPNHVVDGSKLMQDFSHVQRYQGQLAKEVNAVKSGAKSAADMNLDADKFSKGDYKGPKMDEAALQNTRTKFYEYYFDYRGQPMSLLLPVLKANHFKYSKSKSMITFFDNVGQQDYKYAELKNVLEQYNHNADALEMLKEVKEGPIYFQRQASQAQKPSNLAYR